MLKFNCTCNGKSFYDAANDWWLEDESVTIPDEYASWGSFIQLHDASLKTQVSLCEELVAATPEGDEDARKLALVWGKSIEKFAEWSEGQGDLGPINEELETLRAALSPLDTPASWGEGLAKWFNRCEFSGISIPLGFAQGANLEDSENVVLEVGASGTSLPSRDYYTEEKFATERTQFSEHLTKVGTMFGFAEDFAARVLAFETKLAQIQMKPDQSRLFDQTYTITTLDDFIAKVNELKSLEAKQENYPANTVQPVGILSRVIQGVSPWIMLWH